MVLVRKKWKSGTGQEVIRSAGGELLVRCSVRHRLLEFRSCKWHRLLDVWNGEVTQNLEVRSGEVPQAIRV